MLEWFRKLIAPKASAHNACEHAARGICESVAIRLGCRLSEPELHSAVAFALRDSPYERGEVWEALLLKRRFVKILAGEVRADAITSAIDRATVAQRESCFAQVAAHLQPDLDAPHRLGSFFDPDSWQLETIDADADLILGALASAMLCQEDGIKREGVDLVSFARTIAQHGDLLPAPLAARGDARDAEPAGAMPVGNRLPVG